MFDVSIALKFISIYPCRAGHLHILKTETNHPYSLHGNPQLIMALLKLCKYPHFPVCSFSFFPFLSCYFVLMFSEVAITKSPQYEYAYLLDIGLRGVNLSSSKTNTVPESFRNPEDSDAEIKRSQCFF